VAVVVPVETPAKITQKLKTSVGNDFDSFDLKVEAETGACMKGRGICPCCPNSSLFYSYHAL